jgi:GWxTD domain-containing protein
MIADTTFGWTLVHFVWQGTALAALVALVLAVTRSASVRYAAGCAALGLMAVAPVLTWLVLRQPGLSPELGPLAVALGTGDGLSRATAGNEPVNWIGWLPMVWVAGVAALSLRLVAAAWGVHRLTHRGAAPIEDRWPHLRERLGLRRTVGFLSSTRVAGPAQAGFLKAVILLPASLLTQLPAAQLEAIVAHELAHIRRHDYLVNLMQSVVETLLFYHPAVWWVSRVVRAEREVCCDHLAAAATGNKRDYAEALVALEQFASGDLALTLAATGGDLRNRVARLLGHDGGAVKVGSPALLTGLLIAAAMAFPLLRSQAQNPPAPIAAPIPQQNQLPLGSDVGALQQEIGRLQRELAELRAETAARIQQQAGAERLSAIEAERLARTEAQRSLDRIRIEQTEQMTAIEAQRAAQDEAQRSLDQLNEVQAELIRIRAELDVASQTYRSEHPRMQALQMRLKMAQAAAQQSERGAPYDRWLHEDVVYIISQPEVVRFKMLTTDSEREEFIEQFWKRRDSNPATAENEFKEEHYRRISHANKRFATDTEAGWKTARGRMYIVKGPPDEIESHPAEGREKWLYRFPHAIYEFKL